MPTSKRKPGACDHQDKAPCFLVSIKDERDYHYPDEAAAVMFALRHSYGATTTVFDPDGNIVVEFKPRKQWERPNPFQHRNDDMLVAIARAGIAPPIKKAAPKRAQSKPLIRKGRK